MAVSDFTAGFDIVDPEKLGTAEVGAADSRDEVSQSQNTGGQAEDRAASPSDMEADVDEAAAGASDSTSAEPRAAESGESDPDAPVDEAPASSTESGNRSGTRAEADSATDSASDSASEAELVRTELDSRHHRRPTAEPPADDWGPGQCSSRLGAGDRIRR